jgi:hypothetical protein
VSQLIDKEHIKENLELFSFPRLSGTEYEKKAFTIALKQIKDLGYSPEIQKFQFSTFFGRIYPKFAFPILFWVFFTLYLYLNNAFVVINITIALLIYIPLFLLTRKPENIRMGKLLDSQNLYVKIESKNSKEQNDSPNLIFMAHIDSKGQTITARLRAYTVLLLFISLFLIILILILRAVFGFSNQLYIFYTYFGIGPIVGLLIGTLIFTFNKTNNKSKGVVDNASGVVCVLEIMKYFAIEKNVLNNYNVWFVLTGAEETGTMGIRYFYRLMKSFNKNKTIINNFESLGNKVIILASRSNIKSKKKYFKFVLNKAKEYGFRAIVNPVTIGLHTDGAYLLKKGYNTYEHGSPGVGKFMHSEKDSINNVNIDLMETLCNFHVESMNFLDSNFD